mmetsp:Transcript_27077/g.40708  ORF Transcript_27077/g.40708 Transcript_27077/m.40708 type:complete len:88 (-) Transcript_27077:935-1198(-)
MRSIRSDRLQVLLGSEQLDHGLQALRAGVVPEDEEAPVEEPGALLECSERGHFFGERQLLDGEFDGGECDGCLLPVFDEDFAGEFSP